MGVAIYPCMNSPYPQADKDTHVRVDGGSRRLCTSCSSSFPRVGSTACICDSRIGSPSLLRSAQTGCMPSITYVPEYVLYHVCLCVPLFMWTSVGTTCDSVFVGTISACTNKIFPICGPNRTAAMSTRVRWSLERTTTLGLYVRRSVVGVKQSATAITVLPDLSERRRPTRHDGHVRSPISESEPNKISPRTLKRVSLCSPCKTK